MLEQRGQRSGHVCAIRLPSHFANTVFVAIIVPVDNKKNAFWGPLFGSKIVVIFGIFILYFALSDPSRPFFQTIFVMLKHLSTPICFFIEILRTKQCKIVSNNNPKSDPKKCIFLIINRYVNCNVYSTINVEIRWRAWRVRPVGNAGAPVGTTTAPAPVVLEVLFRIRVLFVVLVPVRMHGV